MKEKKIYMLFVDVCLPAYVFVCVSVCVCVCFSHSYIIICSFYGKKFLNLLLLLLLFLRARESVNLSIINFGFICFRNNFNFFIDEQKKIFKHNFILFYLLIDLCTC